jgi:hypothetical protein
MKPNHPQQRHLTPFDTLLRPEATEGRPTFVRLRRGKPTFARVYGDWGRVDTDKGERENVTLLRQAYGGQAHFLGIDNMRAGS